MQIALVTHRVESIGSARVRGVDLSAGENKGFSRKRRMESSDGECRCMPSVEFLKHAAIFLIFMAVSRVYGFARPVYAEEVENEAGRFVLAGWACSARIS